MKSVQVRRQILPLAASIAALLEISTPGASAATIFWDGTDTTANADGGSGTWNTTNTNWDNAASGGANTAFTANDTVTFGGTAGTVTLAADLTLGTGANAPLTFTTAGYTIDAASTQTLTLGGTGVVSLRSTTFGSNVNIAVNANQTWSLDAGTSTINGIVSGSSAITVGASNTLVFANTANSFTGKLTMNQGTVEFKSIANVSGGSSSLGAPTTAGNGTIAFGTATNQNVKLIYSGTTDSTSNRVLNFGASTASATIEVASSGNLTFTGTNTAAAGAKTIFLDGSSTGVGSFTGAIPNATGNISVTKNGTGTWSLSANNGFAGGLTLNNGILKASGSTGALGAGTLTLNGGKLDFNHSASLAFNRATTVAGDVEIVSEKNAAGSGLTYTLTTLSIGANTLTVSGGNINSGTAALTFSGTTTLTGGANFNLTNPNGGGVTQLSLAAVTNGANTATFKGNGNFIQTGVWGNGAGGLTLDSTYSGIATLSQANTYSGTTTVNGGVLRLSTGATALPGGIGATGGTSGLTLNGGYVEMAFDNFLRALGAGVDQVQITGGTSGFSASGAARIVNLGNAGATVTWGSGSFSPTTLVLNGTTANNTLDFQNAIDFGGLSRTVTVGANTATMSGALSNGTLSVSLTGNLTLGGTTSNTITLANITAGTLQLNKTAGIDAFAGNLTIAGGTVKLLAGNQINDSSAVSVSSGTFDNNGQSDTIGSLNVTGGTVSGAAGTITVAGAGTTSISGGPTFSSGLVTGTSGLALSASTLSGALTLNGNLTVDATGGGSTLSGALTINAAQSWVNNNTTSLNISNAAANSIAYNGLLTLNGGKFTFTQTASATTTGAGGVKITNGSTVTNASTQNPFGTGTLELNSGSIVNSTTATTRTITNGVSITGNFTFDSGGATGNNTFSAASSSTGNNILTVNTSTTSFTNLFTLGGDLTAQGTGAFTLSGGIELGGGNRTLTGNTTGATTISGALSSSSGSNKLVLSGSGVNVGAVLIGANNPGIEVNGSGTYIFNGASTFAGDVTLTSGTLKANTNAAALGAGALFLNGGTLDINNTAALIFGRNTTVGGNVEIISERGSPGGAGFTQTLGTLSIGGQTLTVSGGNVTSGTTGLTFGATTLTGAPTFTITNPTGGGTTQLSLGAVTNGANTATFKGNGNFVQTGVWGGGSGGITLDATYTGTVNLSQANTFGGDVTLNSGTLMLSNDAALGTGTLVITGGSINVNAARVTTNNNLQSWNGNFTYVGGNSWNTGTGAVTMNASRTVTVSASTLTVGGAIGDGGFGYSLTKAGAGTLTLSGSNTYSGGTVINGGTLSASTDANLGASSGGLTLGGGRLSGGNGLNGISRIVTVNGTGSSIFVARNNTFATSGKLTGSGELTLVGAGPAGTPSIYTFSSTANDFTGALIFTSAVTGNFDKFADGTGNIIFNADSNGGGVFNYGTTGTSALTGMSLSTRAIEINSTANATVTIQNSSTTQVITIGTNLVATGAGAKTLALVAASGPNDNVFTGVIADKTDAGSGTVAISKSGAGTWSLSNANNTFTGAITVSSSSTLKLGSISSTGGNIILGTGASTTGILEFIGDGDTTSRQVQVGPQSAASGNATILNNGSGALIFTATTFNISDPTTGGSNGSRNLTLGGSYTGGVNEIQGDIVANAFAGRDIAIIKTGASSWKLIGNNTYTQATDIQAGYLIAGNNSPNGASGAFGNASSEITLGLASGNSDAGILIDGAFDVGRIIRIVTANNTDAGSRVLTLGSNTAANSVFSGNIFLGTTNQAGRGVTLTAAAGGQVTFSGVIQNPTGMDATTYTVTKSGNGTVVLSNTNTYTGKTTVQAGTLAFTVGATGATDDQSLGKNGSLDIGITSNSAVGTLLYNGSGAGTLAKNINALGSGGNIIQNSGGALTLSGTLAKNGTTLTLKGGTFNVTGAITGSAANSDFIVDGSYVKVSNNNTYNGPTTVSNSGTLELEVGGSLSGTTAVTVNTGGTLLLNSTSSNIVNTGATATINAGTITFGNLANQSQTLNSLTLSGNATLDFGTTGNDKFFFGSITRQNSATLAILNWDGSVSGSGNDQLVFSGVTTDFTGQFGFNDVSFNGSSGYNAINLGNGTYEIVPVPEPATTALIGAVSLCALIGYRERRRFIGKGRSANR